MTALAPMLLTSRSGEPLVLEGVSACGQLHDALAKVIADLEALQQKLQPPPEQAAG